MQISKAESVDMKRFQLLTVKDKFISFFFPFVNSFVKNFSFGDGDFCGIFAKRNGPNGKNFFAKRNGPVEKRNDLFAKRNGPYEKSTLLSSGF